MAPFADCKPPPSAMDDTKPSIDDPNPSIGNIKQVCTYTLNYTDMYKITFS